MLARTAAFRKPMSESPWLARRFGAMLYDLLILAALWMLTAAICLGLTGGQMDVQHPPWWQRLALLIVSVGYFLLSWSRGGQTIGMRAWRLRLRAAEGGPVSVTRALVRIVLASLSLALVGAGFWWAWFDHRHLTAHDRLCATKVERLPKRA